MLWRVLYVVLAFWILVGGGVFLVALSGGPAGIGKQLHAASTLAKGTRLLGLVVVVAFGIAVPIAVLIANGQDKARVGPGGITLTANEATGRTLFAHTCATCHTLAAAAAVGHVGPDLDILLPSESLVLYSIKNGFARGNGDMPAGLYTGQPADDIAQFVAVVAGGGTGVSSSTTTSTTPAPTTPVALGQQLYTADGCSSCHTLNGTTSVGPSWKGVYGSHVTLTTGRTVLATVQYLSKHIVDPNAMTVRGFPKGVMAAAIASFDLPGKPKDVAAIVAFIKSLAH
jgi:mono/diheme cytochrome c family protein